MKRSRLIALLLTALMMLSVAATGVFALDETGTPEPSGEGNVEAVLDATAPADNDSTTIDNENITVDNEEVTVDEEITPAPAENEAVPAANSIGEGVFNATANGSVVTLEWKNASDEDAALVSKIVVKKDGTEVAGLDFTVSPEEKNGKTKSYTLDYGTTYTFELWLDGATEYAKTTEATTAPAAPTLYAYPAYHSVYLAWTPSNTATKYVLYRNDGAVLDAGSATTYLDANNAADTTYYYQVVAFNGDVASAPSNAASGERVRTCYYKITFKKAVTLTSHDGTKTKNTFRKGQVVYADGFAQGMYQFDYAGHRYHAKWMRIKSPSGNYSRNAYVNGVTPTLYVNQVGYGSPTGYLIWISLYSQRVYIFQGSAGNWTLINHDAYGNEGWQCGSGKAKTPTPTGMNKSLHKKMKKYSKHKWWNCFSGNNAIHGSNGQKEIKKLGKLISNGCVRVTNEQAIWIFNNIPKKTRVLVF